MSSDKRVTARSDTEVRRIAERAKVEFGVSQRRPIDILRCLQSGNVYTLYGRKKLIFDVIDDELLGNVDAKTEYSKGIITITCKRSVRGRAERMIGRDRMTLAHELGHAAMHHSAPMFRLVGAAGMTELSQTGAHTSAEHQAKVFASAFLIHDIDAAKMRSVEEISKEFAISLEAAQVCFDRLNRKAERQRSGERVRKSADEVIALLKGKLHLQPTYLPHPCICGMTTLRWEGTKVRCGSCGFFGDHFQDGDKAG